MQLFGNENPIGKTIKKDNSDFTICAVVSGIPKRSNYAFDFIAPFDDYVMDVSKNWSYSSGENTIIELLQGTDIKAFEKKLSEYDIGRGGIHRGEMTIKPLTKIRYLDSDIVREVKFQHIIVFAISGIFVIVCSLFNYMTLFVSRFRIRQKELALRVVCGASGGSLLKMLSVEFLLTLFFAVFLGFMLTQLIHIPFLTLSEIQMDLPAIYRESLVYIACIILISLLLFWLILYIFRKRSLNLSIRQSNKNLSRKISVIVQLIISIAFAFCTIVILKQMYFLHNTNELGFSFKNRGSITVTGDNIAVVNQLKHIPEITEVLNATGMSGLIPMSGRYFTGVFQWDDKPVDAGRIDIEVMRVTPEYMSFYDFKILAGEMLNDADPDSLVLINESTVKIFGWSEPVGKLFGYDDRGGGFRVKGIIKNVCNLAPTIQAKPVFYSKSEKFFNSRNVRTVVLFKYNEGTWKSCKEKIEQMRDEYPTLSISNAEETYNNFLKSENALIKLLSFVSVICILICVFGFVSLVSLTCEERRKDIAIRKINGATVNDIISIFAKEYFLLLIIGAIIAFSAGYFIMSRWLENYVTQTSISAWIYFAIILVLALIIVLCVGWQVYKASVENPAEVVKGN